MSRTIFLVHTTALNKCIISKCVLLCERRVTAREWRIIAYAIHRVRRNAAAEESLEQTTLIELCSKMLKNDSRAIVKLRLGIRGADGFNFDKSTRYANAAE